MLKRVWSFIQGTYFGASMIVMVSLASYILTKAKDDKKREDKAKPGYKDYWNENLFKVKRGEE